MDQRKIGKFLQMLCKEKGLTQEQLVEQFHVSRRTISRWETGSNMPDLDLLIEISDFYDPEIREILDGERRSDTMNDEMRETLEKAANYTEADKKIFFGNIRIPGMLGAVAILAAISMETLDILDSLKTVPFFELLLGASMEIGLGSLLIILFMQLFYRTRKENTGVLLQEKRYEEFHGVQTVHTCSCYRVLSSVCPVCLSFHLTDSLDPFWEKYKDKRIECPGANMTSAIMEHQDAGRI